MATSLLVLGLLVMWLFGRVERSIDIWLDTHGEIKGVWRLLATLALIVVVVLVPFGFTFAIAYDLWGKEFNPTAAFSLRDGLLLALCFVATESFAILLLNWASAKQQPPPSKTVTTLSFGSQVSFWVQFISAVLGIVSFYLSHLR